MLPYRAEAEAAAAGKPGCRLPGRLDLANLLQDFHGRAEGKRR